jgi:CubicO group peptidase (beta-lactamase class C family)
VSAAIRSDTQQLVQEAIDQLVESGAERGVQVAVYQRGVQVVDAVSGVADPGTGRRVSPATPFYNFSIVKAAAATLTHILVDRGLFGYETPVAGIWPEFGAHAKGAVTLRQVLNHTAGVPGIPLTTTFEDLCDWEKMCAAIADEELWWEPGTQVGYHAYTFGYIVGEIIRRATGQPLSTVLRGEIGKPLGIADELYFGMPASEHHRLAVLEDAEAPGGGAMPELPHDLPMFKAGPMSLLPTAYLGNRSDVLAADIPAGGKTSARAIARMYAALVGAVDGVRLISAERLREAATLSKSGVDAVFGMPSAWALGYSIGLPGSSAAESPTAFGVGGAGGSMAYGDTATGIAFAITKNRLTQDFNAAGSVSKIVNDALGREDA